MLPIIVIDFESPKLVLNTRQQLETHRTVLPMTAGSPWWMCW